MSELFGHRLAVGERGAVYVCALGNGKYVRMSGGAYDLVRSVTAGVSFEELAQIARRDRPGVSAEDIEVAYRKLAAKLESVEASVPAKRSGFWLRFTVLPARVVAGIARPLGIAYHPACAAVLLATIAIASVLAVHRGALAAAVHPDGFGAGYLLFLASVLAHELGHASACARFGAQPRAIGAAMYLLYPALYTDVTDAWRLPRHHRVIVDLGGTYFQLVVGSGFAVGYFATGWPPLRIAMLLITAACALSLNPILKFDGYWVLADALGVTNLSGIPARLGGTFWSALRGKQTSLPWRWPVVCALVVYSVVAVGFWGYFVAFVATHGVSVATGYPSLVRSVWDTLAGGSVDGRAMYTLLEATLMLGFGGLLVVRLFTVLAKLVTSARRGRAAC